MGLRFRKRITIDKTKKTWVNLSGSGVSASTKIGAATLNFGKSGVRSWVNLPGGLYYVSSKKRKVKETREYSSPSLRSTVHTSWLSPQDVLNQDVLKIYKNSKAYKQELELKKEGEVDFRNRNIAAVILSLFVIVVAPWWTSILLIPLIVFFLLCYGAIVEGSADQRSADKLEEHLNQIKDKIDQEKIVQDKIEQELRDRRDQLDKDKREHIKWLKGMIEENRLELEGLKE